MGSKRVHFLRSESSPWDPGATFLGDDREAKGSKGVNPQLPNFREVGSGATNDYVINVCQDVYREVGKVGFVAKLCLKGCDSGVKKEAKEGRRQTFALKHAINHVKGFK